MYQTVERRSFIFANSLRNSIRVYQCAPLKTSDPRSSANQEEYDVMGEIAMLTRDASHPSGIRMCMVISRALLIGQRRRGLLIKTQARACYPSELLSHLRQDRAGADVYARVSIQS